MKRYNRLLKLALPVFGLLLTVSACKKSNSSSNPASTAPKVQIMSNGQFGNILTDSSGRTLYFFSLDANGQSACSGSCVVAWPVFYSAAPTLSAGLNGSDFATITRTDGTMQTTYKGWPLYYFSADSAAGSVKGDAIENVWFVGKPDYSVMLASTQLVGNDGMNYIESNNKIVAGTGMTQYLTDPYGRTLYLFSHDSSLENKFTASNFSNNTVWPIDTTSITNSVPSILPTTQFANLSVFGMTQFACKGWPLYYFSSDSSVRGNTRGVSVPTPGVWPILNTSTLNAPM
jgi:predicted lipoprotein with Yx(FWY)xxD motif